MIYEYNERQLEAAINFLLLMNPHAAKIGYSAVENSIFDSMQELSENDEMSSTGTMGYLVSVSLEIDPTDEEEGLTWFEIMVDPDLAIRECKLKQFIPR